MTRPDAFTTALQDLAAASTALEYTAHPTLKDVERARDRAKSAHELLDASAKFLKRGIYAVTEEPPLDQPLFTEAGAPAEGVHTEEAPPLITLDVPHAFDGRSEEEQVDLFNKGLDALEEAGVSDGLKRKAWKAAEGEWCAAWDSDRRSTYTKLEIAMFRNPMTWNLPEDSEVFEHQRALAVAAIPPDPAPAEAPAPEGVALLPAVGE